MCVHRQTSSFSSPFTIDDETGDFCSIDPTLCPQCRQPGAFVDAELPPLPEDARRMEDEQLRIRRDDISRCVRERAFAGLNETTRSIPYASLTRRGLTEQPRGHPTIRQLNGFTNHVLAFQSYDDSTVLQFAEYSSVGILDAALFSRRIAYYEVRCVLQPMSTLPPPHFKCGFALLDGMELSHTHNGIGVGETSSSWAFDSLGRKLNGEVFPLTRHVPDWEPYCTMGFAVNLDTGMIACSKNGRWDITNRCGVMFEQPIIMNGVYPCISGRGVTLEIRYMPESLIYSPPPDELWVLWPKYQDLSWISIPGEARAAAMAMGYTSITWAWSGNPIDRMTWDEMKPEQQEAGKVLGYNRRIWNQLITLWSREAQDNPDSDSEDDVSLSCFHVMFWNDLPDDARQAAITLGYSKTTWEDDSRIPLGIKWFSQLTQEQRRAAIILGYDSHSWNEYAECYLTSCNSVSSNASHI